MSSLVIIPLKHVSTSTFYDKIYSESAPFCLFLLIIQTSNDYHHFIMIVISSWPIFCFKFYTLVYLWYDDHGRTIHMVLFHCWKCYRVLKERLCQLAHLQVLFSIQNYCLLWKQKNMMIFRIKTAPRTPSWFWKYISLWYFETRAFFFITLTPAPHMLSQI